MTRLAGQANANEMSLRPSLMDTNASVMRYCTVYLVLCVLRCPQYNRFPPFLCALLEPPLT